MPEARAYRRREAMSVHYDLLEMMEGTAGWKDAPDATRREFATYLYETSMQDNSCVLEVRKAWHPFWYGCQSSRGEIEALKAHLEVSRTGAARYKAWTDALMKYSTLTSDAAERVRTYVDAALSAADGGEQK